MDKTRTYGNLRCCLSDDDNLMISDIVSYGNKQFYVDTRYVYDGRCLETMVFDMKINVDGDFEADDDFNSYVDWSGIYQNRYWDSSEAKRFHIQIVENLRKSGSVKGAMN